MRVKVVINWLCVFMFGWTVFMVILLAVISAENTKLSLKVKVLTGILESEPNPHQTVPDYMSMDLEDKVVIPAYREIEIESTAYCPCEKCCGIYSDGVTATGADAFTKGIAVDPKVIPLGTIVEVPDYGKVYADDVGGEIKGGRIDVRFKTHQEAREYGRRTVRIRVYK